MRSEETCSNKDMPEWLKKCLSCKHAYKTKDNDLEWKCRCRHGKCNFKPYQPKGEHDENTK